MTTRSYLIHEGRIPALSDKIAKIARRAAKLGLSGPALRVAGAPVLWDDRPFVLLLVSGEQPCLSGWRFVAALDALTGEDGERLTIVRAIEPVAKRYTGWQGECEHCQLARKRLRGYVLRHDDGREAMVGSSCLGAFVPHGALDPLHAAQLAEWLHNAFSAAEEAEGSIGGGGSDVLTLDRYLPYVAMAIREWGWVSRTKAREQGLGSTADAASGALFSTHRDTPRPTAEDIERAQAAIDWARAIDAETDDIYLLSCRALSYAGYCNGRTMGIAASIVAAHRRALNVAEEQKRREASPSIHVGTPGKREAFSVTIEKMVDIESDWGGKTLYVLRTPEGALLKAFHSGGALRTKAGRKLDVGDTATVKATVKKHGEYKGQKETVVHRIAVNGE